MILPEVVRCRAREWVEEGSNDVLVVYACRRVEGKDGRMEGREFPERRGEE